MAQLSTLLAKLPEISQSRMVSSGHGLWLVWGDEIDKSIQNTLLDYGVMLMAEGTGQALYFCNTTNVFRALARLQVWSRVNAMPVFCQIFPATLQVGYDLSLSLSMDSDYARQVHDRSNSFEVLVHPKFEKTVQGLQGMSTKNVGQQVGLVVGEWHALIADQGLDYESSLRWFFIIKPLGKLGDKESIIGWRDFSSDITELLQKLGIRYVSDVKEGSIFFPLDSLRLLKTFCGDILQLISLAKTDESKNYWPVVMAVVPQGNMPFNEDIPRKAGIDWNKLSPDFPHLHFGDAFLLIDRFKINEARHGTSQINLNSWCNIGLSGDAAGDVRGTMEVALPSAIVLAEGRDCFYCGQRGHIPRNCPTRTMAALHSDVWQELAKYDSNEFDKAFSKIDQAIEAGEVANIYEIMGRKGTLESVLVRGMYEINSFSQLRMLPLIWRSRGKDIPEGLTQLAPEEGEYFWSILQGVVANRSEEVKEALKDASSKYPRSYQHHNINGFLFMEREDYNQALFHWEEAERLSYTPLQQGFFVYLQARLKEVSGEFKEAVKAYGRALVHCPRWIEPMYRQSVCLIKMGFTGQAMDILSELIGRDPNMFNRIMIDPEFERGRVQLMGYLWDKWTETEKIVIGLRKEVKDFIEDINKRFNKEHEFYEPAAEELERLKQLGAINNYVAFRRLIRGTEQYSMRLDTQVRREIMRINNRVESLTDQLRTIQKEAAWFPFPKLLLEFNKDFNYCVEKINWIKTQHLKRADNFRSAIQFVEEVDKRIKTLQGRLVTLRIIRDTTLYVLMLGRNFIWFELLGLGLALATIFSVLFFGESLKDYWFVSGIINQEWEFSKGLVIILSIACLALAAIKSALSFEKRKTELFANIEKEIKAKAPRRY